MTPCCKIEKKNHLLNSSYRNIELASGSNGRIHFAWASLPNTVANPFKRYTTVRTSCAIATEAAEALKRSILPWMSSTYNSINNGEFNSFIQLRDTCPLSITVTSQSRSPRSDYSQLSLSLPSVTFNTRHFRCCSKHNRKLTTTSSVIRNSYTPPDHLTTQMQKRKDGGRREEG